METKLFLLFILLSHAISSLSERCHPEDKRALLQIKKELNNPTLLSSWKPHTDCCKGSSWYGVDCYPFNNRVASLTILNNTELTSQFPPSIGNLRYLESLFIYQLPNLKGPIPQSISKLTNLKYLTISLTGISGPIPNFKAPQLKNLINFDLSHNNLIGTLPPSLYQLPNLSAILFQNNKLTGSIPPSYGYFNNTLAGVVLSHNNLSGRLPVSLARLNSSIIDLSYNKFEGDASMLFGSTKVTVSIDLSWNLFAFDFGKVELTNTLTTLDASHNKIYGKLPLGIENISLLNVSYNRLCGEIPKGGNLQSFDVYTYFHNKCLCGSPLPNCN